MKLDVAARHSKTAIFNVFFLVILSYSFNLGMAIVWAPSCFQHHLWQLPAVPLSWASRLAQWWLGVCPGRWKGLNGQMCGNWTWQIWCVCWLLLSTITSKYKNLGFWDFEKQMRSTWGRYRPHRMLMQRFWGMEQLWLAVLLVNTAWFLASWSNLLEFLFGSFRNSIYSYIFHPIEAAEP